MTTATMPLSGTISAPVAVAAKPAKKSFFARLYAAMIEARMRAALREIHLHSHLFPEDVRKDLGSLPFVRGA